MSTCCCRSPHREAAAALEQALRDAIWDGRLAPGARLPSTRALAEELGLSRGTVVAAYEQLAVEGYLIARHGAETRIAPLPERLERAGADPSPQRPRRHLDLTVGSSDVGAFPVAAWLRSIRRAMTTAPADWFGYADPRGHEALRAALAEYLGRARGVATGTNSEILVTSGAVHGTFLLGRALMASGVRRVAVEDPGYWTQRNVLAGCGLEVVPLPVDAAGACTDLLTSPRFAGVQAVVVTPAHQYPTGTVLSPDRRRSAPRCDCSTQRPARGRSNGPAHERAGSTRS